MTNGSMTKAELVEEVSRVSDLTKKHSEVIVASLLEVGGWRLGSEFSNL